jgi:hypothetical protein
MKPWGEKIETIFVKEFRNFYDAGGYLGNLRHESIQSSNRRFSLLSFHSKFYRLFARLKAVDE